MIYDTNDQLRFTLQEEKGLLMIEKGDEDAQNKKENNPLFTLVLANGKLGLESPSKQN